MTNTAYRWEMTAADQPLIRQDFDPGEPGDKEVLVEIAGCGVCHTDLGFYYDGVPTRHGLPLALGHEISGHVTATGRLATEWLGKAVIIPAVMPCGECDLCQRGKPNICPKQKMPGNDIQGGFATHIVVPAFGLCEVDLARLDRAGLQLADLSVVADAMTTPYQAAVQAGVSDGDLAIVIGAGGVGGYAVQIANAMGAKVVAIDVDDKKLDALTSCGAALTLNAKEMDGRAMKKAVQSFAADNGLRRTEWILFECSGTGAGQKTAFDLLTHGATLCVVGFSPEKPELMLSKLMAFHARALGNWGCPPDFYPGALEMVLDGLVKVAPFVERHKLDDINSVFEAAHHGELTRRAVLVP